MTNETVKALSRARGVLMHVKSRAIVARNVGQEAYNALRALPHTSRDRLPPVGAIKLGAQPPILVRGIYYEGWHAAATPTRERHVEDSAEHVLSQLPREFPVDALTVARGVFEILWEKLDPGEFEKVLNHLPASLRAMKS